MKKLLLSAAIVCASFPALAEGNAVAYQWTFTGDVDNQPHEVNIRAGRSFILSADLTFTTWNETSDKSSYLGQWGTPILSTGDNAFGSDYTNGFQLWLNNPAEKGNSNLTFKNSVYDGPSIFDNVFDNTDGTLRIVLTYDASTRTMHTKVGDTEKVFTNYSLNPISAISTGIQSGVTLEVTVSYPDYSATLLELANKPVVIKPLDGGYLASDIIVNAEGKIDAGNVNNRLLSTSETLDGTCLFEIVPSSEANKGHIRSLCGSINNGTVDTSHSTGANAGAWMAQDATLACFTFNQGWAQAFEFVPANFDANNPVFALIYGNQCLNGVNYNSSAASFFTISEVKELPVTTNAGGFAAICLPVAVNTPANSAFAITENNATRATITQISDLVPAGTPFVLKNDADKTLTLTIANESPQAEAVSFLKGYPSRISGLTADDYYTLSDNSFARNAATELPAGSAYILKSTLENPETVTASLELTTESTGIEEISADTAIHTAVYDLQGRRLAAPVRGINVINGRKTLVK